ncbi:MAG: diaminopimelate epimerase, partial [Methylocystis sp.]
MTHPLDNHLILRMNGAGNEILVLDLRGEDYILPPQEACAIGAQPGLHFDQLMVLHDPISLKDDAFMRIYNLDGSQSAACGNGTRCVAFVLAREGKTKLHLETQAGQIRTYQLTDTIFTVDMGPPRLNWHEIPLAFATDTLNVKLIPAILDAPTHFSAVSMGNPHAIFFVEDINLIDLEKIGPLIERHSLFPQRVNVSFAQIINLAEIQLRVWERGTGVTKACGSAACAALVAAARSKRSGHEALIRLPGGDLQIKWRQDNN